MLFYNCSVSIYSTVAGLKCKINLIVTVRPVKTVGLITYIVLVQT